MTAVRLTRNRLSALIERRYNNMITGLTQQTLEAIASGEPGWLKSQRLAAWQTFEKLPLPTKRDLQWQRFDIRALKLDKITLPADQPAITSRLTPVSSALDKKGLIFCDMATALAKHGDVLKDYLGKSIAPDEPAKVQALHAAPWKSGAVLYVPPDPD